MNQIEHARDIPDAVFLGAVKTVHERDGFWAGRTAVDTLLSATFADVPSKVSLAKAQRLITRGLMDGCACGCRGDYYLTPAGEAFLETEGNR